MRCIIGLRAILIVLFITAPVASARAQNDCTPPSPGPDVIVGALTGIVKWGTVGDITGYSIGTDSCNIGDQDLEWAALNNRHPVIAQNMYRLKDNRFEQIGMSWLKHGFQALALDLCCDCNDPGTGALLGVGCSDPYSAGLNGNQTGFSGGGGLGPRSEVNPYSGVFAFPYMAQGQSGNSIYKRLQVNNADLDPSLNSGALYFAEGHYISPDDAEARNRNNNASYQRMVVLGFSGGGWNVDLAASDETHRQEPAIFGWNAADPVAKIAEFKIANDGLLYLGYKATELGGGWWHYEYALHNLNAHRGVQAFTVPVADGVTIDNVGFHDVDYHSGEPYDGTDWSDVHTAGMLTWYTDTFATNPNANALRWGTLYNFRFDAAAPPRTVTAVVDLFRPGTPATASTLTIGPMGAPEPALAASYPHDRRKNRYISFDPNKTANDNVNIAFQVELKSLTLGSCSGNGGFCRGDDDCRTCSVVGNHCINLPIDCSPNPPQSCDPTGQTCMNDRPDVGGTSVGHLWWVGPDSPLGNGVHLLVSQPFRRVSDNWPNPTHVGDCEIVPQAVYGVRAFNIDMGVISDEVEVETALFAPISSSWWGDSVGPAQKFCSGDIRTAGCTGDADCTPPATCDLAWTLPDGAVNFDDISAALALRAPSPSSIPPDVTWVDLHGNASGAPGSHQFDPPNFVINSSDVQNFVFAFSGRPYTFYDPADCPDVGTWP